MLRLLVVNQLTPSSAAGKSGAHFCDSKNRDTLAVCWMSLLADNFKSGSPFTHHDFTKTVFRFSTLQKRPIPL